MKDKEKPEAIITVNGLDPIQWQEEKEGRVAVLFVSEPVDEDENCLNGCIVGNGARMASMMKHVLKDHPDFRDIMILVLKRYIKEHLASDVMDFVKRYSKEPSKEE
ncbi:MAG: hypothetical protein IJ000_00380 [Paludibacteraceae bacterium]|nr:hypothetical protein [Paludibacteraceae bacterium]